MASVKALRSILGEGSTVPKGLEILWVLLLTALCLSGVAHADSKGGSGSQGKDDCNAQVVNQYALETMQCATTSPPAQLSNAYNDCMAQAQAHLSAGMSRCETESALGRPKGGLHVLAPRSNGTGIPRARGPVHLETPGGLHLHR